MQKADFSGAGRIKAVGFSIGNKGYIGTGQTGASSYLKDFWEFDPCNAWIRKSDFPGTARTGAVGFSIGNKGYIGTGDDGSGNYEKDFWEYDSSANTWTRKADFGGAGRRFAFAFSIGNKGYIGTGETNSGLASDFWEYDTAANTWTQVSSLPAAGRKYAGGFVVNGNAYVGCGTPGPMIDFWEYYPVTDSWTQKTDYPGMGPEATVSFTLGSYGYMGLGDNYVTFGTDLWQYDTGNDTWAQMANFTGTARESAIGFSICGKGYVGTGGQGFSLFVDQFWEYTPPGFVATNCFSPPVADFTSTVTNVCGSSCANFSDASLFDPLLWQWTFSGALSPFATIQNPSSICYNTSGSYDVTLIVAKGSCADTITKNLLISIDILPVAVAFPDTTICNQQTVTLGTTGGVSYSWSPASFLNCTSCQNPTANPNQTTTYTVTVTDSNGCSASDTITITILSPIADFTAPSVICIGECVDFTDQSQNSPAAWQWTFTGANTPVSNIQNPNGICYLSEGSFSITLVTSNQNCPDTITKPITVVDSCNSIGVSDSILCPGECIDFFAEALPTASGFLWSFPGASPASSTSKNPTGICYSGEGIYSVSVTFSINGVSDTLVKDNFIVVDDSACPVLDTITVSANGDANGGLICADDCLNFTAQSTTTADTYLWEFPGGQPNTSSAQNPVGICYAGDGVFDVILIYSKNGISDTIIKMGFVNVVHTDILVSVSDSVVGSGSQVQFNAQGGATYNWTSDALLDCYDCPNPVSLITAASSFFVEVMDSNGCLYRDTILVSVENSCEDAVLIASAFSPNGDTKNDFIQPFVNADISLFTFKIFNRWGEEVFSSNDTRMSWDGTYKGAQQDVQVFTYIVQFSCLGKEYLKSGNITLIR